MRDQFTNCPNCGTRNFSDDKFCGVCNLKISGGANIQKEVTKENPIKKSNAVFLIVIIGFISFAICLIFFYRENSSDEYSNHILPSEDKGNSHDGLINSYSAPSKETKSDQLKYTLLNIDLNNTRAFNISVRINKKLSDDQLKALGLKIRLDVNTISDVGVIFFLLPKMKEDEGAWAAIDYNPAPSLRYIFGTSIDVDKKLKVDVKNITDYVGLWIDDEQGGLVIRIRKGNSQGYFFEYIDPENPKPSDLPIPLIKKVKNGKIIYVDLDHPEEYYFVNQIGDLVVIDNYGIVVTYKKLK